jgi:hypothetical protein
MNLREARKLRNGDEVVDKVSGESVRVLSISLELVGPGQKAVMIEGLGQWQGYNWWQHTTVK